MRSKDKIEMTSRIVVPRARYSASVVLSAISDENSNKWGGQVLLAGARVSIKRTVRGTVLPNSHPVAINKTFDAVSFSAQ